MTADKLPPNIPPEIRNNMNFIFGKNAFFGVAPASDGVSHFFLPALKLLGNDVVDKLGSPKGVYSRRN